MSLDLPSIVSSIRVMVQLLSSSSLSDDRERESEFEVDVSLSPSSFPSLSAVDLSLLRSLRICALAATVVSSNKATNSAIMVFIIVDELL